MAEDIPSEAFELVNQYMRSEGYTYVERVDVRSGKPWIFKGWMKEKELLKDG